jgi:TP901 family phage tail tape measure protein
MTLKKTGVQLVADGAQAFNRALADGDKAVAGFGKSATQASGQLSGFGQIATGALRQVGAIAVNALADAGRAVAGFVGDSVKKAGDFQAGLNEFAAVTGGALKDSGKSLKDFSDLFIQLGRDLPVSTKDVEDAAIELAKGGIDPATIAAGALKTSLSLAAAGGLGLADSATIMSKQLGVWVDASASATEKSAFLTQTADLLSQAANVTTSNVSDMALGLANVGGVAKLTGLSFRETVQTMALLAPSFSSAGDAGTSFKSFLQRLQPQTKPAIAAMKNLGLYTDAAGSAFFNAQGQFVGMENVSALLKAATEGLSEAQKAQAFQTIFGTDAIRVAALVSEQGAAGYEAMGKQLDAAGTVADQAAARQQGYNTALENAKGSFEALQLTVGSYIIPILTNLLNTVIAPGINSITAFADAFFSASDKMGFLTTAINGVLPGFATLVSWLQVQIPVAVTSLSTLWSGTLQPALITVGTVITGTIVPGLISLNTWITTNVGSWGQIATAVGIGVAAFLTLDTIVGVVAGAVVAITAFGAAVTTAGSVLGGIVAILGGPVTVTIAAVAVAVAGLALAWNTNFLGIRDSLTGWWNGSGRAIFEEVRTWLADTLATAVTGLASLWTGTLQPALATATAFVESNVVPVLKVLAVDGLQGVVIAATAVASFWTSTLQPALSTVWSFVQANVIPVLKTLAADALQGVITVATSLASFWTGTLQPALSAVWSFINGSVIPVLNTLAIDAIVGVKVQAQFLSDLWNTTLLPALTAVWSFVDTSIVPLFVALADVYIAALKLATTALAGIWQKELQPALSAVWSFIDTNVVPVFNTLGTVAMVAVKVISQELATFWNNTLQPALTAVGSVLSDTVSPAVTNLSGFLGTLKSAFGGISSAIQTVTTWLGTLASDLNNIKLPDWMTPGSPTPWEIGLWGISAAMRQVAGSDLPLLQSNLQKVNTSLGATAQYTKVAGGAAGTQFVAGMSLGVLKSMSDLLAAMRKSTDSSIQEILGEIDANLQSGQALGIFNQFGADAMNAFVAGMNTPALTGAFSTIKQSLNLLFTPPNTSDLTSALATVKGTVLDLGALLKGNATSSGSLQGDTRQTFTSIVDLTHQAWEQVRLGISNAVIDARTTVDTATKAILTVSTESFTKLRATSDLAWSQIHKGITDQITLTQAGVKLSTDTIQNGTTDTFQLLQADSTRIFGQIHLGITNQIAMTKTSVGLTTDAMHKATTATWGLIGADAASGWQKVKTNIETPVTTAKDTVAADSTKMQQDMVIPPTMQDQIFESYRHVTDVMIAQLERVTVQIQNVIDAWSKLINLPSPKGPGGTGGAGTGIPGSSAPPGGSRDWSFPGRALGGPVVAGMSYLVGERGRELFVPQTNGSILPASMTQRIAPPASAQQIAYHSAIYNQQTTNTWHLSAQYRYQSERSLAQDIRQLQLMYPSA